MTKMREYLLSAARNDRSLTVRILLFFGVKPDIYFPEQILYGASLLHSAVLWNNNKLVKLLLRKNVNLNAKDKEGYTPLMLAAVFGYLEVCQILIDAGADSTMKNNLGLDYITFNLL
jgi:ankyrin repeat protein